MTVNRRELALGLAGVLSIPTHARAQNGGGIWTDPQGRYLPILDDTLRRVEAERSAGTQGGPALSVLAQVYAMLGDERRAMETFALTRPVRVSAPPGNGGGTAPAPLDLSGARAEGAIAFIERQARSRQIVILNEAHHLSRCRAFATRLIRALRPLGFTWFAAETFSAEAETWSAGDSVHPTLGYYVRDPVYASLVREAGRLGMRLCDYEMRPGQELGSDASQMARINRREERQAQNLVDNLLRDHPDAKVFVLCGYGHAADTPSRPDVSKMFAAQLKEKTGIDPLTISQSTGQPALVPADDPANTAAVVARFRPNKPVVVSRGEAVIKAGAADHGMDISVFHPRLPSVSGRPGWLAADPRRHAVHVNLSQGESTGPMLVQALPEREQDPIVPADQVLLDQGIRNVTLFLPRGRYRLRLETRQELRSLGSIAV